VAFEQVAQRTVADLEKRARELVGRIEDRTERIRAEREAQRQVAEMKRAVQSAANSTSRGVRIVRDGQAVPAETPGPSRTKEEDVVEYVAAAPREIVAGDKVKLLSFGSVGIVDQIKDGYAEVRVKALRFREKLENLELVEQQPNAKSQQGKSQGKLEKLRRSTGTEVHLSDAGQNARSELNVIGQTTDEAVDAVDKFLDEASLASLSRVRIVHGHGTGALRRAIANLLGDHPHVARFVAAPPDQGGTGATLVELRQ
jgi:DNA mismatch repair protein MutS2